MFTSRDTANYHLIYSLAGTVFLAVFGAIYEYFSHGVYSYYMIYAFAIPLIMGVVPYSFMLIKNIQLPVLLINLWNSSILTYSVGSVFAGVLSIYGTTNALIFVYPVAGTVLLIATLIAASVYYIKKSLLTGLFGKEGP